MSFKLLSNDLDYKLLMIDATFVKVHPHASVARGGTISEILLAGKPAARAIHTAPLYLKAKINFA